MRKGFSQQLAINITPIGEVVVPNLKRDHMVNLLASLQHLYKDKNLSEKVESILRKSINTKKKAVGRTGLSLWEIFVFGQLRLCMNTSYDQLLNLGNFHHLLRGILGVGTTDYTPGKAYTRQSIYDNVTLLDNEAIRQINEQIVEMGHGVFKKKEAEALRLKTDSFVVETDTYFPTDYRLLYDSGRKCLEIIGRLQKEHRFVGWRQWKDFRKKLKSLYRSFGRATSGGGRNKAEREAVGCANYLATAKQLRGKVATFLTGQSLALTSTKDIVSIIELEWYAQMLDKHIDLLERRIVKGEKIPQQEKMFSIFQPFTEWINKGKMNPSVEIGKKLFVTTDQFHLIVDHQIGEHQTDSDAIVGILNRIHKKYTHIASLSTDKGFSTKGNKTLIGLAHPEIALMMPKKGKRNQQEEQQEKSKIFRKLNNAHNAIESNINELENRGLDRCPDRSVAAFGKYVSLAVSAYNLHKIGKELISIRVKKEKKQKEKEKRLRMAA